MLQARANAHERRENQGGVGARLPWRCVPGLQELAREMREGDRRGEELGLTEDEVAFHDALEPARTVCRKQNAAFGGLLKP